MAAAKVKNVSVGPRGAWLDGSIVMAEAGEVIEADDFSEEWFAPEGKPHPLDHDGDGKPGGSPKGANATRSRGRAKG